jgi:hypothetical protein
MSWQTAATDDAGPAMVFALAANAVMDDEPLTDPRSLSEDDDVVLRDEEVVSGAVPEAASKDETQDDTPLALDKPQPEDSRPLDFETMVFWLTNTLYAVSAILVLYAIVSFVSTVTTPSASAPSRANTVAPTDEIDAILRSQAMAV